MKSTRLRFLLLIFCVYCLQSYADIFPKTEKADEHKLIGFGFNITRNLTSQGMIYSPLKKDSNYTIKCSIDKSNTDKKIKISVHFDGESSAQHLWGKGSKSVTAQIDGNAIDTTIIFQNLKPIKLNEKWIKKLKIEQEEDSKEFYVIDLGMDPVTQFKGDEEVKGACDITSTE